jgi:hypothetical protein
MAWQKKIKKAIFTLATEGYEGDVTEQTEKGE